MKRTLVLDADRGRYVMSEVNKGCPQGGLMSPLLWCMVVDSLLNTLKGSDVYTQAYADDVAVLSVESCLETVYANAQMSLDIIDEWCAGMGFRSILSKLRLLFLREGGF